MHFVGIIRAKYRRNSMQKHLTVCSRSNSLNLAHNREVLYSDLGNLWLSSHTLRGTLIKTEEVRNAQQTNQYVYSIPRDCNRCYIGEKSRLLEVRIKEHEYNLTPGRLDKSKLAKHAYEESRGICWTEVKVFQIETNTIYRKYKESAHMSLVDHPISQPSLGISSIWTPIIAAEVRKPQLRPV
jgi:hypothetical protein